MTPIRAVFEMALEENRLGLSVVFEVAVEVEVVGGEVGEGRSRKAQTVHPVEPQGVGGDLHRHVAHAVLPNPGEELVQIQREGRGVRGFEGSILPPVLDRSQHRRGDTGRGPDRLQEIGRAGLAVGAGETRQGHVASRVAKKLGRQQRHRCQRVPHPHAGKREVWWDLLHHRHRGPGAFGRLQKSMTIRAGPAQRDETRARPHLSGIVGEGLDPGGELAPGLEDLNPVQQSFRLDHRAPFFCRAFAYQVRVTLSSPRGVSVS